MTSDKFKKWFGATVMEALPWPASCLLGFCSAGFAVSLTCAIAPLRAFPLLLALPAVILAAWFLGMLGGICCAFAEAFLVDAFLTKHQFHFALGNAEEGVRMAVFLIVSILLGWAIRRLARNRAQLAMRELQQRLSLANAERELAEERARAVEALRDRDTLLQIAVEGNGMALWAWDLVEGTIYWSDAAYRIIGREKGSVEPGFDAWRTILHPEDAGVIDEALKMVSEGRLEQRMEYRILWPDETIRWLESQGKGYCDADGRMIRVVGVFADVTHRKLAEEAMLRAEKLAIAGRLAASVAHEINNPLEAMSNMLFLITLADSVEAAREYGRDALEQLLRVSMITQQTLKFHRQAGAPKLTSLSEVLNSVLALFRGKLKSAGIAMEFTVEHEVQVTCMPNEAQQIFANLISNAIDAMPKGGRLVIRLYPSHGWKDRKTEGMRITVSDTGLGMDRATRRRVFEPFFTTKTDTGTGLGMWVVAQLVDRHHGSVSTWSTQRDGRSGTTFSVFLPFDPKKLAGEHSLADGSSALSPAAASKV